MPIRILEKDPVRMKDKKTTAKWITKKPKKMEDKETTAKWITKKPTKWITKKQPTNWITKKEAKEHDTTSARKWITKKKPVRSRSRHQSVAEDKRLSPTDKYKRDVLGQDMSDKYIDPRNKKK